MEVVDKLPPMAALVLRQQRSAVRASIHDCQFPGLAAARVQSVWRARLHASKERRRSESFLTSVYSRTKTVKSNVPWAHESCAGILNPNLSPGRGCHCDQMLKAALGQDVLLARTFFRQFDQVCC
jgi:hypothetical protein